MVNFERVAPEIVAAFSELQAATIHEAQGGTGALSADFRPLARGMSICGPALTVKCKPGDNLLQHQAIALARPGDVILVDCGGYTEAGQWGGVMMEAAIQKGVAGFITNGSVRDTDEIIERGFPVFSRGISIKGTTKFAAGTIGGRMVLEDAVVEPGDLVRADSDGIVVVGRERAAEVLELSRQRVAKEDAIMAELRGGKTTLEIYGFPPYTG